MTPRDDAAPINGHAPLVRVICAQCGGAGAVTVPAMVRDDADEINYREWCAQCAGRGWIVTEAI